MKTMYLKSRGVGILSALMVAAIVVLASTLGCGSDATGPATGDRHVSSRTAAEPSAVDVNPVPPRNRHQHGFEPVGKLISWTEGPYPAEECVTWEYDKSHALVLNHQFPYGGAGLSGWSVDITVADGIVSIAEYPQGDYVLPYPTSQELEMEISHLRQGVYTVIFTIFYLRDEPLEFTIDLINEPSGQICFDQ